MEIPISLSGEGQRWHCFLRRMINSLTHTSWRLLLQVLYYTPRNRAANWKSYISDHTRQSRPSGLLLSVQSPIAQIITLPLWTTCITALAGNPAFALPILVADFPFLRSLSLVSGRRVTPIDAKAEFPCSIPTIISFFFLYPFHTPTHTHTHTLWRL